MFLKWGEIKIKRKKVELLEKTRPENLKRKKVRGGGRVWWWGDSGVKGERGRKKRMQERGEKGRSHWLGDSLEICSVTQWCFEIEGGDESEGGERGEEDDGGGDINTAGASEPATVKDASSAHQTLCCRAPCQPRLRPAAPHLPPGHPHGADEGPVEAHQAADQ